MTAEHDIDQLYGARPEDFTALRTKLVAAAKKRGDADGGEGDRRRASSDHRGVGGERARPQR